MLFIVNEQEKILHIVRSFRKVNRALYQLLSEEAKALETTAIQILVMRALAKSPDMSLGELAERLQVGNSTMSGIVERLVQAGLVIRERSQTDRRSLTMRLTPKGEATQREAHFLFMERLSGILQIPDEDLQYLLDMHDLILEKLQ